MSLIQRIFKNRRPSKFLINPKFQLGFLSYILGLAVVNFTIFYASFWVVFENFYKTGQAMNLPPRSFYFQFLNQQHSTLNTVFIIVGVVNTLILVFGGIALSHRVAGPLYRLKSHALSVSEGKTDVDVKFRKYDYFQDLAEAYNVQMREYRKKVGTSNVTPINHKKAA